MPDDLEILPVEIHLPGLLKVLGEHLYSNPRVAVRELIQNAHDSCVRRREEDREDSAEYSPAIIVRMDTDAHQLLIEDNGSGLTHDEITVFLATVGRGYTRELRERLTTGQREEAMDLIGMFGLGLLSAFMIASRIEITTRSYQTPEESWRWISDGGQSYALRQLTDLRDTIGTTVRLKLRDDARFLLDSGTLRDTLRMYAAFLPIPISIGDETTPINNYQAPWVGTQDEEDVSLVAHYRAWVREYTELQPLTVIPLHDILLEDGQLVALRGVLYVPPRSVVSVKEYGELIVYVRHMLITERERDLLPSWARFVSGVIDYPLLNPTASRETLRHDDAYTQVQTALARILLTHFEHLADTAPLDWEAIVHAHNDLIKGWAVRAPELFTRVADLVSFKTSRGELTLPEYLHENPGRIFYYEDEDGITQALALFEARNLAVIDARWFADTAFLRTYGSLYGISVEELTPAASYLFTPIDDPDGVWQPLVEACRAQGYPVKLLAFEPTHLPIILLYPSGSQKVRRAQRNMQKGQFNGPIRSLVRSFLDRQQRDETVLTGVLHLNTLNPLLRHLRDLGPQHDSFTALLSILVANARMFSGQNLSAQDTIGCFEQINRSLAQLSGLDQQTQPQDLLKIEDLTSLGISADAASRLCAQCETISALLNADLDTLAQQTRISPLLLATVREELSRRA